ncbi:MAG TPA: PepSY domain-containing protein [Sphingomicrobium sp.]|jgi:uncharacterized iron-regulated membrane protein|nr:PepSY domain-containing protein [Sphingomicrobium sp.]
MKKVHTHVLRVLHKWLGLIIGIQLLLWTLSGAMMAILPMEEVAGGEAREPTPVQLVLESDQWPQVVRQLSDTTITSVSLRPLLDRPVFELTTDGGTRLFDATTAAPITIDAQLAARIASVAYAERPRVDRVEQLGELTLPVRDHQLPIWRVDFADEKNSSYYVSGSTGAVLQRRNDTWRVFDFFWMLHIMDYAERTSFNHPLIWMFGLAAVWLAITGVWLLFRTGWRSDFKTLKGRRHAVGPELQ